MADLHMELHSETRRSGGALPLRRPEGIDASLVANVTEEPEPSALAEASLYRRAVEAAIWGMPLVTFDAMRQAAFADAGARYTDILHWSEPAGWTFQAPTPEVGTRHVMFFANLKDEPVVLDLPPAAEAAFAGTLIDSWNLPLIDVGLGGEDEGRGYRYLLIPPDHEARHPEGYLPVRYSTYNVCGMLRLLPKSDRDDDLDDAAFHLRKLSVHSLSGLGAGRRQRFIDMAWRKFDGLAGWDANFYAALARMVAEEPVKPRDQAMMGLLHTLGIGKDRPFEPDARTGEVLAQAIAEAHAFIAEGREQAGVPAWAGRAWMSRPRGNGFMAGDRLMVDERAFTLFGAFGLGRNQESRLRLEAFADVAGEPLDGTRRYRLRLPAGLPPAFRWSLAAYDCETAAFLREAVPVGLDSRDPTLQRNGDGSLDLDFGPLPLPDQQANFIATGEGRSFFLVFRAEAPPPEGWALGDLSPIG